MKKNYLLALSLLALWQMAFAQVPPKREMRAVWIAHVSNIDWPSRSGLSAEQQRQEFINILNEHQRTGINAVVVQVRSACDAVYPSSLEPWSEWLTGRQGQDPGYDPLRFMIAECRKRGMEFHAWFNPYRAVVDTRSSSIAPNHLSNTRPEWVRTYGTLRVLDPGLPDVRNHVISVIMDVVRRYDIDAVHFDDYFYPYPQTGLTFNDDDTYARFGRGIANRNDWRRDNINLLIRAVNDSIRAAKPWVKFGVSPFGIWQNRSTAQPLGSDTRGLESFSAIFADSRRWAQEGWLDYIAPQLYWSIGFSAADYGLLLPWWVQNSFGRHLYIGQGAYRIGTNQSDANWLQANQMPTQLRLNRRSPEVHGSIFFSSKSVTGNFLSIQDSLRRDFYRFPALVPAMPWRDAVPPGSPGNLTAQMGRNGVELAWNRPQTGSSELDRARYFVLYRFEGNEALNLDNARAIRHVTPNDTTRFVDITNNLADVRYTYVVTAVDRLHNESTPSAPVSILVTADDEAAAPRTALGQNQPNPMGEATQIPYSLAKQGRVRLRVLDVTGREVALLIDAEQASGNHVATFQSGALPAGLYVYVMETEGFRASKRLMVSR